MTTNFFLLIFYLCRKDGVFSEHNQLLFRNDGPKFGIGRYVQYTYDAMTQFVKLAKPLGYIKVSVKSQSFHNVLNNTNKKSKKLLKDVSHKSFTGDIK